MNKNRLVLSIMEIFEEEGCSSISFEINNTEGNECVALIQCPPAVIKRLIRHGYYLNLRDGKLFVFTF